MRSFIEWSKKESSLTGKLAAGLLAGLLFVGLIPLALLCWLPRVDNMLGLHPMHPGLVGLVTGGILILVGAPIGFWTVIVQILKASGTPLPMFPTQRLLVKGPYAWSRNPMVFGTVCAYLGLSLLVGSWTALGCVLLFTVFLWIYIKFVEERELEMRFGQPYLDYKRKTSFIIPWPPKRG
ncbi:MAG: isoprenylcysteine carboxylmethyltransferase family protein [Anaerolineaceae bacterium]